MKLCGSGSINLTVRFSEYGEVPEDIPIEDWIAEEVQSGNTIFNTDFSLWNPDSSSEFTDGGAKVQLNSSSSVVKFNSGRFIRAAARKEVLNSYQIQMQLVTADTVCYRFTMRLTNTLFPSELMPT